MKKLQIARIGYIVISAIFFFAALLCLLFPRTSPFAVCLFGGVLLVAYGIIKVVGYFSEDLFCLAFRYDFAFGLLLLAAGGLLLVRYQTAAEYLVTGFGWLLLLDGFFRIQTSQKAKTFGLEQWGAISAVAIAVGVIGFRLILSFGGTELPRIWIILAFLTEGILNRCVVRFTVKPPGTYPVFPQNQT